MSHKPMSMRLGLHEENGLVFASWRHPDGVKVSRSVAESESCVECGHSLWQHAVHEAPPDDLASPCKAADCDCGGARVEVARFLTPTEARDVADKLVAKAEMAALHARELREYLTRRRSEKDGTQH